MKTNIRVIMASGAIVFALLGGSAIGATHTTDLRKPGPNGIQIQVKQLNNSETIRLTIDNPEGRRFAITLSDVSGTLISRVIAGKNEKEVIRDFNFEAAEEGTYKLDIYDGHSDVKKEIHLKRVPQPDITQLSVQ